VQVLQHILCRHVVMFCFVTGLGCHYSQLLFITRKHFQCHNQTYSRLSVNTQPFSSPLYMFFPCWVCYSVAIWTVLQPYLSTIHVQTDINTLSKLWWRKWLISEMNYGFFQRNGTIVTDTSNLTDSVIFKNAVRCPTYDTVLKWKIDY